MKTITTFIIGGLSGVITGLLLAPKSGDKTRKEVKDKLSQQLSEIENNISQQSSYWRKIYNSKVDKLNEQGKSTIDEVSKEVKA